MFYEQVAVVDDSNGDEKKLDVWWKNGEHHARLVANLETRIFSIYASKEDDSGKLYPVWTILFPTFLEPLSPF